MVCEACGYKANLEKARAVPKPPAQPDPPDEAAPEEFHTPGRKTIAEVAEFDGLPETSHLKSLVMVAGERRILVLLRGDHQLNEAKLGAALGTVRFPSGAARRAARDARRRRRLARAGRRHGPARSSPTRRSRAAAT